MNAKLVIAAGAAALAFALLSARSFGNDPLDKYPVRIKTKQEAAQLPLGMHVALVCKSCKTILDMTTDRGKTYLSWYDSRLTHDCPNCSGKLTWKNTGNASSAYSHYCTHCGANSAYMCAEHGWHTKN
jgi:hypothetical protein